LIEKDVGFGVFFSRNSGVFNRKVEGAFELTDSDDFLAEISIFDFPKAVELVND